MKAIGRTGKIVIGAVMIVLLLIVSGWIFVRCETNPEFEYVVNSAKDSWQCVPGIRMKLKDKLFLRVRGEVLYSPQPLKIFNRYATAWDGSHPLMASIGKTQHQFECPTLNFLAGIYEGSICFWFSDEGHGDNKGVFIVDGIVVSGARERAFDFLKGNY